jgi:tetratricopeptide (TPR) repeat protein
MTTADLHGLPLSTSSAETASLFNDAVLGFLKYRADTPKRAGKLIATDPDFAFGHTLRGYFLQTPFNAANLPAAREELERARSLSAGTTRREQAHVEALATWVAGDIDASLKIWEQILAEHPLDLLAFRLHHFNAFWHGRPDLMGAQADAALRQWGRELPAFASMLGCHCFAHEELGDYTIAEKSGREAVALAPDDMWATHAIAHVLEMQGRHEEGIAWLETLEPNWEGGNNLMHHLWWHRGLYHYERGEFDRVLGLYDRRFRNLASPLTQAQPDFTTDIQNAVSMLFRLQRQGVDIGDRWGELADRAEARIGDVLSPFTQPHWMLALCAAGRWDAAGRMIEALRSAPQQPEGGVGPLVRAYAAPIAEAILARAKGDPGRACDLMRPALAGMNRLGGSHAQQDVLEQFFLDCAVEARRKDDVAILIERVRRRHPVPPEKRMGYRDVRQMLN